MSVPASAMCVSTYKLRVYFIWGIKEAKCLVHGFFVFVYKYSVSIVIQGVAGELACLTVSYSSANNKRKLPNLGHWNCSFMFSNVTCVWWEELISLYIFTVYILLHLIDHSHFLLKESGIELPYFRNLVENPFSLLPAFEQWMGWLTMHLDVYHLEKRCQGSCSPLLLISSHGWRRQPRWANQPQYVPQQREKNRFVGHLR